MTSATPPNHSPTSATTEWMLSVDFGTTSTVAAITHHDRSVDVLEVDGERRMPSVVLVDDDGTLVVGQAAVGLASSRPERTIRAPKRRLGEQTPVVLGGKPFSPVDLVASVLRHIRAEAVRHVGSDPTAVRLTHPATWSRPLQQRLLEAAAKAGMPDAELVPEPVAAAMAAADRQLPVGSHIAVYDLGGGTFDTTVVRRTDTGFVVVGHPIGDRQIGGELFDEALMNHVGSRLDPEMWEKLQVSEQREWHQASSRLLAECRRVKESLSSHTYGEIIVGTPSGMIEERITRAELEAIVAPYLDASIELVRRCVDDVGIQSTDLSAIHMIGGASRMPLAAEMVEQAFPGVEVSRRGDPRTAVAIGASLVQISGMPDELVGDRDTTLERRQFSIDTQSPPAAAAAAPTASPPPAEPTVAEAPADDHGGTVAEPAPASPPTTTQPTVSQPATVQPQQAQPVAAQGFVPAAAASPADGFAPAPPPPGGQPFGAGGGSSSLPMPALFGAGALAIALIVGAVVMLQGRGDGDTDAAGGKSQPSTFVSTNTTGDPITTSTTLGITTTTASTTSSTDSTSSTTAVPTGPTRDDAVGILFDVSDLPGTGWENDTYLYEPIEPCGLISPHAPAFIEGRNFIKNRGQIDATTIGHTVLVYANETEAAQVMDYNQTFANDCPTDTINISGTDFTATFLSCDPFATCDDPLPASTADFLAGDEFAIQAGVFLEPDSLILITDQVFLMRVGRSIVQFEYIVPDQPSESQIEEASTLGIEAWGRANGYPR